MICPCIHKSTVHYSAFKSPFGFSDSMYEVPVLISCSSLRISFCHNVLNNVFSLYLCSRSVLASVPTEYMLKVFLWTSYHFHIVGKMGLPVSQSFQHMNLMFVQRDKFIVSLLIDGSPLCYPSDCGSSD